MVKLKRQYDNEFPSVTEVLGVLRKIGLENWFKYNTIDFINATSSKGKLIGTQIHEAIENYILKNKVEVKTEYAEEVTNALKSFALFRKENPEFSLEWSEMMLTSLVYGYNGTVDCKATCSGVPVILDWKTGEAKKNEKPAIYDEYKTQVAAYVFAYNEVNKTNINQALIVSFAKDKIAYNTYLMEEEEIKDQFNEVFLSALRITKYQKGGKKYGIQA